MRTPSLNTPTSTLAPAAAPRFGGASPAPPAPAATLRPLRSQRRVSRLELSMRVGVSQRHLSCTETGRARPRRDMLVALLDAPLAVRNDALLAAGYTPAYSRRSLSDADMAPVRDALARLLGAHDPAPALVMDDGWTLLQGNRGLQAMSGLAGVSLPASAGGLNLLHALLLPGGLVDALVNADEVCADVWQRAQREAPHSAALRATVEAPRPQRPRHLARPGRRHRCCRP